VPELIASAVAAARPTAPLDVLDLGCGTGLCGPVLRPMARTLAGVDLSAAMVEKARARGVYDRLDVGDLVAFMRASGRCYDLLVAADVFIYLGDLSPAFEAAAGCLRPGGGGMLAFSAEAGTGERYAMGPKTRRFTHAEPYLRRLAAMYGFEEQSFEPITVRIEAGRPVAGYLVVLRWPGA
jgi:predicted TPR repeat methyltransferase